MTILDLSNELQVSLVELKALDLTTNVEKTFYYSTTSYITKPTDSPSNVAYQSRVVDALDNARTLEFGGGTGAVSSVGHGKVEISNIDGALDELEHSYALTGRSITVKTGDRDGGHVNLLTIFTGAIKSVDFSNSSLVIEVQDSTAILDVEVSKQVYVKPGGVGEPTFNTSLHGSYLPVCYGEVFNVSPSYVGKILQGDIYTATFDPYYLGDIALSNGDLTAINSNDGVYGTAYSTISVPSGKYYVEIETIIGVGINAFVGVASTVSRPRDSYTGSTSNSWGYYSNGGGLYNSGSSSAFGADYRNATSVIGIAVDGSTGNVWFSLNNVWQNSGDPAAGTNPAITGISGSIFIAVSGEDSGATFNGRFTSGSLTGTVPTGFNSGTAVPVAVSELVYQVHDGAITDITNVYSNGAVLSASEYTKYLSEGKFQINVGSVSGATITADVQGDSSVPTYNLASDIIKDILQNRISPPVLIDNAKFTALSTAYFEGVSIINTASSGVYYQKGGTASKLLAEFNKSYGLYSGFDRGGVYDIGIFLKPDGINSIATITEENILEATIITPRTPNTTYVLGYHRNHTVLTESTIAPVVLETLPDHYAFLVEKYKQEEANILEMGIKKSDNTAEPIPVGSENLYWDLLHRYPLAVASTMEGTVIQDQSSALLESRRRWLLYNSDTDLRQRTLLSIKAKLKISGLQVNDTVELIYDRFGLGSGKFFRVVGYKEDLSVNEVVLEVWG